MKLAPNIYKLDYIESDGSQWIQTNDPFNSGKYIGVHQIDFQLTSSAPPTSRQYLSGYSSSNAFYVFCRLTTNKCEVRSHSQAAKTYNFMCDNTNKHTLVCNYTYEATPSLAKNIAYIDSTEPITFANGSKPSTTVGITFFTVANSSGVDSSRCFVGRVYRYDIGTDLGKADIYNLIPAINLSNNQVGMYDGVTGIFHQSSSGVNFIAGPFSKKVSNRQMLIAN